MTTTSELLAAIASLQSELEAERGHLAHLLHGELGGLLAAARMELSRQRQALPPQAAAPLAEVERQLTLALELKRDLVESLRPGLLEHFGLAAALRAQFERRCEAAQVALALALPQATPALAPEPMLVLYRIAGRLLEAAIAGGARAVSLQLQLEPGGLCLRVGQDSEAAPLAATSAGYAQQLWLERLGGSYRLGSTPEAKSVSELRLPLDEG